MEYKRIENELSEQEIGELIQMICPDACIVSFERHTDTGFIRVYYTEQESSVSQIQIMDLLPDEIYVYPSGDLTKEVLFPDIEVLYKYRQYTFAKGYSSLWVDNPFCS